MTAPAPLRTPARAGRTPLVQLVLADDWELRGDGSGNARAIQFETMRRLRDVYERHGIRGSFNAEVMQQLTHRRLASEHPELAEIADAWERSVREAYSAGHDVQLHLHPQWSDAHYSEGRWDLRGPWSILDYPRPEIDAMLVEGRRYLEELLRPLDPAYRCVSFRSGSWTLAPSPDMLPALAHAGIVFDMSIAEGLHYETEHIRLDYRTIDEPFLPYYPRMDDARRMASEVQPIVCVPTHTFPRRLAPRLARALARRARGWRLPGATRLGAHHLAASDTPIADGGYVSDYRSQTWSNSREAAPMDRLVSDLASLSGAQMRDMLRDIRTRARRSGWETVPVILENHTKDVGDFSPFERFASEVEAAKDVEVITLSELADNLSSGCYPVKTAGGD